MSERPETEKEKPETETRKEQSALSKAVEAKSMRKIKARNNPSPGIWFGLGMMGLIGWSVVVPTLLGAILGLWLDRNNTGNYSWTLMLLLLGLIVGCLNAWHWVSRENKDIHKEKEDEDE